MGRERRARFARKWEEVRRGKGERKKERKKEKEGRKRMVVIGGKGRRKIRVKGKKISLGKKGIAATKRRKGGGREAVVGRKQR